MNSSNVYNSSNVSILYPNSVCAYNMPASSLASSCFITTGNTTSPNVWFKQLIDEFIRQLSDDVAYILNSNDTSVYWTYDKDSDIIYVAHYEWNANTFGDNIILRIYEGPKVIDTIYFERLDSTNGFIWVEIDNVNLRWEQDDKLLNKQTI